MLGIYFAWPQIPSIMSIVYFLHLTARGLAFFFCVSVAKNKITIVAWALETPPVENHDVKQSLCTICC